MNDMTNETTCGWCDGPLNACKCELDNELLPLLADLIRQVGVSYFSTEPRQLQKQVKELGPTAFWDQKEACFRLMASWGMDVDKCRKQGMTAVKTETKRLCEEIEKMSEAECRRLLAKAECH